MAHPSPVSFSHVGIYVRDMDVMERFYAGPLGMMVTDRGPLGDVELVFLSTTPDEHHELVLASGRPARVDFNVVNQISFRVASFGALKELHAQHVAYSATDIQPVTHGIAWSVYCRDPEGNRIELFADSPWYVDQPVRVPFDITADDAEIVRTTEAMCRDLPGFKTRSDWQAKFSDEIESEKR